ncbi:MAG TPA: NAD(P)-dependent oxidoreductase [Oligoflexia bacterium]|nr:NAD(P)-dependent oxidoreductase [Oligoflexia bacterium]HMR24455.1 NAD(P)-dependent oxidoreductase [Oligoflexia bacterium]
MKILITGSTGFIGQNLLKYLDSAQYQITILNRKQKKFNNTSIKQIIGDLHDQDALRQAVVGQDMIVHLAGCVKAKDQIAFDHVNVEGTKTLLDAVLDKNPSLKRFILISSLAAAGPARSGNILDCKHENEINQPISMYGESKHRSEKVFLAHAYSGEKVILRPPIVYGPHDYQLLDLFKLLSKGLALKMQGKEKYYSMVFVEDFCKAIQCMLDAQNVEKENIFYVADPQLYSMQDIIHHFQKAANIKKIRVLKLPKVFFKVIAIAADGVANIFSKPQPYNSDKYREMLAEAWTCSPNKIKHQHNFECQYDLQAGFEKTIQWYQEQRLLK